MERFKQSNWKIDSNVYNSLIIAFSILTALLSSLFSIKNDMQDSLII